MERDANYVAVGSFVLLLLAMGTGFVLWYSETGDRRQYQRYEIYFDGSVFGLSEGGSVRYLGVAVGRIARIGLDPRDPSRVRVIADISDDTPVESGTVARLALQGVTGLLFIDLKPADPDKAQMKAVESLNYPVIPSERSDFDVFISSLPDVVAKAGEVLNRMNAVLSDDNIGSVAATLSSVEDAARDLPDTVDSTRRLLAQLEGVAEEIRGAAADVRGLTSSSAPELREAIVRLRRAADSIAAVSARIDHFVAANEDSISRFADQGLSEIDALVRDMRETAKAVERLSRQIGDDPSRLLYQPSTRGLEIDP
jgi:phospholipid/cholesterol/gamma-HCH transport system substrate-binding protein